jgi:hypothetical protein
LSDENDKQTVPANAEAILTNLSTPNNQLNMHKLGLTSYLQRLYNEGLHTVKVHETYHDSTIISYIEQAVQADLMAGYQFESGKIIKITDLSSDTLTITRIDQP